MIRFMGKNAQFYLFMALVLCISAYTLLQTGITPENKKTAFNALHSNYVHEADNVINNALYEGTGVSFQLRAYTESFIDYAKGKNVNFEVVYMIKKEDEIKVANFLSQPINITSHNVTLKPREEKTLNATSAISINHKGYEYNFTFGSEDIEFKSLIADE